MGSWLAPVGGKDALYLVDELAERRSDVTVEQMGMVDKHYRSSLRINLVVIDILLKSLDGTDDRSGGVTIQ
ncbi:hypothetical protein PsorP6_011533 [Peronosclerospora sorghi]|uniref:Uncharacterized protein n=1 Tax=Peronosclerospora sorghi TaxID=230839 RepID=A0ACC0WJY7_9STRA|nr:hypothetical protein PsorP6_011533 [Peronosclerospora sorghi]